MSAWDPDIVAKANDRKWDDGYKFGRAEAWRFRIAGAPIGQQTNNTRFERSALDARGWAYHIKRVEEGHYGTQ